MIFYAFLYFSFTVEPIPLLGYGVFPTPSRSLDMKISYQFFSELFQLQCLLLLFARCYFGLLLTPSMALLQHPALLMSFYLTSHCHSSHLTYIYFLSFCNFLMTPYSIQSFFCSSSLGYRNYIHTIKDQKHKWEVLLPYFAILLKLTNTVVQG